MSPSNNVAFVAALALLHTSMHASGRRRSRVSKTQPLSPPPVRPNSHLIDDDGEQHTDRRERFTRQGRNSDGDPGMSGDSGKGEDGAIVFIGAT
jgi:hypothetical protein